MSLPRRGTCFFAPKKEPALHDRGSRGGGSSHLPADGCRKSLEIHKEYQMTPTALEKRVAALEAEVATLKGRVAAADAGGPWWDASPARSETTPSTKRQ